MARDLPVPDTPAVDVNSVVPHGASIGALFATFMGWLPVVVAIIPAIYYAVLIFESKTVQKWIRRRRLRKAAKRRKKAGK
jgi:hypothetical protein